MAAGAVGTARAAAWRPSRPAATPRRGGTRGAGHQRPRRGVDAGELDPACAAVNDVLAALDLQASRFRPDSELSWLNAARGGLFLLGDGLAEAVGVALAAARWTGGLTDPTVGGHACLTRLRPRLRGHRGRTVSPWEPRSPRRAGSWCGSTGRCSACPRGIRLDLGATAKGVGADRAVRAVMSATGSAWRRAGQPGRRHRRGRDAAAGRLAGHRGRGAGPGRRRRAAQLVRLTAGAVADLVGHRPALAARRRGAAPHRGPADRAARRTGRGARRPWPRRPAPTPTQPARRRSWRAPGPRTGWPRRACRPG